MPFTVGNQTLPSRRLHARRIRPVALAAQHPVGRAVRKRLHGRNSSVGEIGQLTQAGPVDALVGAHPEIALVVLEDLVRKVVVQAVACADPGKPAVLVSVQATAVRADPELPGMVLVKRQRMASVEPVVWRESGETVVCEPAQPAPRGNPYRAASILEQPGDVMVGQAVIRQVHPMLSTLQAMESIGGCAEPERAAAVLEHGGEGRGGPALLDGLDPGRVRAAEDEVAGRTRLG